MTRFRRHLTCWLLALAFSFVAIAARADEIHVMVSGGFQPAYDVLVVEWEKETGHTVITAYGPSMGATPEAIPNRLDHGERADIVILAREALAGLVEGRKFAEGSHVDLVRSRIGMSVKTGAKKPDISTESRRRQVLLAAKSIAYSDSASGVYISKEMFAKLGIADQVAGKSRMIPRTPVAEAVARGEVEVGFQQISELLPVPGATVVGPIPDSVQKITVFTAGVSANSQVQAAARELVAYLSSKRAWKTIRLSGLDPIP